MIFLLRQAILMSLKISFIQHIINLLLQSILRLHKLLSRARFTLLKMLQAKYSKLLRRIWFIFISWCIIIFLFLFLNQFLFDIKGWLKPSNKTSFDGTAFLNWRDCLGLCSRQLFLQLCLIVACGGFWV